MPDNLVGKVALITGGSSGIGRASVSEFVGEGAKVMVADIDDRGFPDIRAAHGDAVRFVRADVTSESDVASAVAQTVEQFGKLDVMFNNAGALGDPAPLSEFTQESYEQTHRLLVTSVLFGHKYAARQFIAQGGGGAIITTSSIAALQAGWGAAAYTVSKHALQGILRQATVEYAAFGIRSNAVLPSVIATPALAGRFGVEGARSDEFLATLGDRLKAEQPAGRLGQPEDVAKAAVFLASDLSRFVFGQSIAVDGGITATSSAGRFVEAGIATSAAFV